MTEKLIRETTTNWIALKWHISNITVIIDYDVYIQWMWQQIDGLVQGKCNSIANVMELGLSSTDPSK